MTEGNPYVPVEQIAVSPELRPHEAQEKVSQSSLAGLLERSFAASTHWGNIDGSALLRDGQARLVPRIEEKYGVKISTLAELPDEVGLRSLRKDREALSDSDLDSAFMAATLVAMHVP